VKRRKCHRLAVKQCFPANPTPKPSLIFILALLFVTLAACKSETEKRTNRLVRTSTFEGVIFSQQNAEALSRFAGGNTVSGYWTPTQADVIALETGLNNYLKSVASLFPQEPPTKERLSEYHRQYLGIIEDGKQVIYANFFCEDANQDWKNQYVIVQDGGSCYFQLKFEVGASRYYDLHINGEA
jgi:hypothetical protein